MNCDETKDVLTRHMLGELDEATRAEVDAHLEHCESCRAAAQDIEPTLDLLRTALAASSPAPGHLTVKQRAAIFRSDEPGSGRKVIRWVFTSHPRLAAAAALVIVSGIIGLLAMPSLPGSKRAMMGARVQIVEPELMVELGAGERLDDSAVVYGLPQSSVHALGEDKEAVDESVEVAIADTGIDDDHQAWFRAPAKSAAVVPKAAPPPTAAPHRGRRYASRTRPGRSSESAAAKMPPATVDSPDITVSLAPQRPAQEPAEEPVATYGFAVKRPAEKKPAPEAKADWGWADGKAEGELEGGGGGKPNEQPDKPATPLLGDLPTLGALFGARNRASTAPDAPPADDAVQPLPAPAPKPGFAGIAPRSEQRKGKKDADRAELTAAAEAGDFIAMGGGLVAGKVEKQRVAGNGRLDRTAGGEATDLYFAPMGGKESDKGGAGKDVTVQSGSYVTAGRRSLFETEPAAAAPAKHSSERRNRSEAKALEKELGKARDPRGLSITEADAANKLAAGFEFKNFGSLAAAPQPAPEPPPPPVELGRRLQTHEKLRAVVIPELDFRQAKIEDVVEFLEDAVREYGKPDDDAQDDGKKLAIELRLGADAGGAGQAVEADPFADESDADGELSLSVPLITFSAKNITAYDALKVATQVANLKSRVEDDGVVVTPLDAPDGEIIHRMYDVSPDIGDKLGVAAEGVQLENLLSSQGADTTINESLRRSGIDWPEGSSIRYVPAIGKLVVANTADNLTGLEKRLEQVRDEEREKAAQREAEERRKREQEAEEEQRLRFKAYGVNPFHTVAEKTFSTFSIDVDTASYTITRNKAMQGVLPAAEAVRTEEFVNFFDYAYRPPARGTFAVHTECAPSKFGRGLHLLKIGVKGRRLGREEQRQAVLTFLIDTSGSMNKPDRLGLVQKSLRMLVDTLSPHDRIAIIQYESHARLLLEHTPASEKEKILAGIDALQCRGSTNLEEGMALAYKVASGAFVGGGENRVLLLSDGVANLGSVAAEDILNKVASYREQGIYCSVFGFGAGSYDDVMLETLANKGDGAYTFIDSETEARRVFVDDLSATLNTIAANVKIQVEFNPRYVKRYRQLGYENRQLRKEDFRNDAVDAGEIGSGQSVTALYELELDAPDRQQAAPSAKAGPEWLCVVRVRYRRTDNRMVEEMERAVTVPEMISDFDAAPTRFRLAACVAEFAEILRGSPFATGSEYRDLARELRPVALDLDLDARVAELLRIVELAPSLPRE